MNIFDFSILFSGWPGAVLATILGLVFGSFVTMLSYRLPRGTSFVRGRSHCPSCQTPLGIPDLFPLFSWVFHRGMCRFCHKPVPWRYPAIELIQCLLFLAAWWQSESLAAFLLLAALSVCLLTLTVTDFEHGIIPDALQIAMIPLGIAYRLLLDETALPMTLGSAIGAGTGLALRYGYHAFRKRHGLGLGDVKLFVVSGLWLGPWLFVPFMLVSGMTGIALALLWRLLGRGKIFPFGPAMAAALFLCLLFPELTGMFDALAQWVNTLLS